MLKIDDLFKTVISTVESSFQAVLILLSCIFSLKPSQAPKAIAAARMRRAGEHVSGRTLMFFASVTVVVAMGYTRFEKAISQATSAVTSSDLTGHAVAGIILTALLDLLVRLSIGRRNSRSRRLNLLRDGISCWLFLLSLLLLTVDILSHGEYWMWSASRLMSLLVIIALICFLPFLYFFRPLIWRQRGERGMVLLLIALLAPVCLFFAMVSGAASWELDRDDRGDPDIMVQTSCILGRDKLLHVTAVLRNIGKSPLWVQDEGQYQVVSYVGGLQSERYPGSPIFGGEVSDRLTIDMTSPSEGIIEPGKTMTLAGETFEKIERPNPKEKLWSCDYNGHRVARLNELPSRGVVYEEAEFRGDNAVSDSKPIAEIRH